MRLISYLKKHLFFIIAVVIISGIPFSSKYDYFFYSIFAYGFLIIFVILLIWIGTDSNSNWSSVKNWIIKNINHLLYTAALFTAGVFVLLTFTDKVSFNDHKIIVLLIFILLLLWKDLESASFASILSLKKKTTKLEETTQSLQESVLNLITIQSNVSVNQVTNIYNTLGSTAGITTEITPPEEIKPNFNVPITTSRMAAQEYEIGTRLMDSKKWTESIPHFKNALKLEPNHWFSALNLGFIFGEGGPNYNLSESIFYSTLAINLNKTHYNQFVNLGLAQLHTGGDFLFEQSLINFDEALDVIDNDVQNKDKPYFIVLAAKIKLFKALAKKYLLNLEDSESLLIEAIAQMENCPTPWPVGTDKWLEDAKHNLKALGEKDDE